MRYLLALLILTAIPAYAEDIGNNTVCFVPGPDDCAMALLQKVGMDRASRGCGSIRASGRLGFELFPDGCDGLGERAGTETERALYDARLATDVLREVEDRRLTLAEGTHHLKSHDGRIGGLQRLEASSVIAGQVTQNPDREMRILSIHPNGTRRVV
jgi:hypothetical protein